MFFNKNKNTIDLKDFKIMNYKELKDFYVSKRNLKKEEIGFVLSKNVRLKTSKSYEHVCLLGPGGSGKKSSFFIPTLLEADGTHSFVITDPKGEIYYKTKDYLESKGIRVIKLDPLDADNQLHYNPLLIAEDNTQIKELAQTILFNSSSFFEENSEQKDWITKIIPLFTASLAYFKEFGKDKTINEAIDFLLQEDDFIIIENTFSKSEKALNNFNDFLKLGGDEEFFQSIKNFFASNVQLFLNEKIIDFTETPYKLDNKTGLKIFLESKLFDPKMLREKPTALFISVSETKFDYMSPLMSIFYSQMLNSNIQYFGEKFNTPILYMLDNFSDIGFIPNISKILSICNSKKIGVSIYIKNIESLMRIYGKKETYLILDNLKTKLVYSGLSGETAKYISDLTTLTIIYTKNEKKSNGSNVDNSTKTLFSVNDLKLLRVDKIIILMKDKRPVVDSKNTYFLDKKYTSRVREYD